MEFVPQKPVDLGAVLSAASPDAMDLLVQLLVLRPDKRISAAEALRHPFFTKHDPPPCDPSELALPIPEERKNKVKKNYVTTLELKIDVVNDRGTSTFCLTRQNMLWFDLHAPELRDYLVRHRGVPYPSCVAR